MTSVKVVVVEGATVKGWVSRVDDNNNRERDDIFED